MKKYINDLIKLHRKTFETKKTYDLSFRTRQLKRLYHAIKDDQKYIAKAISKDFGIELEESYYSQIVPVYRYIKESVKLISTYDGYCPYGTVLIISPCTMPFLSTLESTVSAIACGNTVFIKPSGKAKNTYKAITKIIEKAFPSRFAYVFSEGTEYRDFLSIDYDFVHFSGNESNAKKIIRHNVKKLTPTYVNFGGKCPAYIDESADILNAANRIVFAKYINSGQNHFAPDYIMVDNSIKDFFIKCLISEIENQIGSDPLVSDGYPAMLNENSFNHVLELIKDEKTIYGGAKCIETLQIGPLIIDNPSLKDNCMKEEILGPIFPIIGVNNIDDTIKIANLFKRTDAFYIFTNNNNKNKLYRIDSNHIVINDSYYSNNALEQINIFSKKTYIVDDRR